MKVARSRPVVCFRRCVLASGHDTTAPPDPRRAAARRTAGRAPKDKKIPGKEPTERFRGDPRRERTGRIPVLPSRRMRLLRMRAGSAGGKRVGDSSNERLSAERRRRRTCTSRSRATRRRSFVVQYEHDDANATRPRSASATRLHAHQDRARLLVRLRNPDAASTRCISAVSCRITPTTRRGALRGALDGLQVPRRRTPRRRPRCSSPATRAANPSVFGSYSSAVLAKVRRRDLTATGARPARSGLWDALFARARSLRAAPATVTATTRTSPSRTSRNSHFPITAARPNNRGVLRRTYGPLRIVRAERHEPVVRRYRSREELPRSHAEAVDRTRTPFAIARITSRCNDVVGALRRTPKIRSAWAPLFDQYHPTRTSRVTCTATNRQALRCRRPTSPLRARGTQLRRRRGSAHSFSGSKPAYLVGQEARTATRSSRDAKQ